MGAKGFFSLPIENVVSLMCSMCSFGVSMFALENRKKKREAEQLQREESGGFEGNKRKERFASSGCGDLVKWGEED